MRSLPRRQLAEFPRCAVAIRMTFAAAPITSVGRFSSFDSFRHLRAPLDQCPDQAQQCTMLWTMILRQELAYFDNRRIAA